MKAAKLYGDSIRQARDSLEAAELYARFCARLDSINFAVAPNTDLLLTEGENARLIEAILAVRRQLPAAADTIAPESESANIPAAESE